MIGKAERFGGPSDVPIVLVERIEHDLAFGLRLLRLECAGWGGRVSGLVPFLATPNLRWNIGRADDGGI